MQNEKNEKDEESEENEENEESDDNDNLKEKTNMINIIINNTNKMNINNININNPYFINLLTQKINSETFQGKIKEKKDYQFIYNEQEKYLIKKGNNSLFNGEIIKYITKLCIKSVDYYSNLNSNEIDLKEIITKNIIKYLNKLIKAEWFVLISDINEENNFEFSYSEINKDDIIIFHYNNYKIYIYLLFLKLNTDFNFETPIQINKEEKIEEKTEEKNIIKNEEKSIEKNEIDDKSHIDKEINTNENDKSSQENDIKIKENDNIINKNDNIIQNNENNIIDKDNEEKDLFNENENTNAIKNEDEEKQENKEKSLIKEDIKEEINNEKPIIEKDIKKENIKEEDNIQEIKIEKDIKIENIKEEENTQEPKIEIDIKTESNDEDSELKNELKEEKINEKLPIIENEAKEEKIEDKLSLEKSDEIEKNIESPPIEKDTQKNNLIKEEQNNKESNFSIINIIKQKIEEIRKEKLEEPKENKNIINNEEIKNENIIININNNIENREINKIEDEKEADIKVKNSFENIFKNEKEIIMDDLNEEKKYIYDVNTYNFRFTKRRQYYKNKNKLKIDNIYDTHKIERNENYQHKRISTMENNILSIYNMTNEEEDQTTNKPIDLIESNNLYYLRQDIRINNTASNIESNKQLYSNIQKRIKRMLINTKIPIFNYDNYKIIKTIGEGTYGQLYSVTNILTKKSYAMKELIATDINYFYQCLTTLGINYYNKHSNILDIYGIYVIIFAENNFFIYALMDLAEGDWEKEIRRRKELYKYYKEDELILILKQLVSALAFLQKRNIAHRDIKLENILLFPNNTKDKNDLGLDKIYKIGDFGEAKNKIKYSIILNTIRGTDYYMSPELLEGVNKQKDFIKNNPHKSDVFSLGCCMMIASTLNYEIIHSIRNPKTQEELNKVIKTVLEKRYSEKFSYLITKMLINDENKRIDFINLERLIKRKYL